MHSKSNSSKSLPSAVVYWEGGGNERSLLLYKKNDIESVSISSRFYIYFFFE
jgi:hypothetical protein